MLMGKQSSNQIKGESVFLVAGIVVGIKGLFWSAVYRMRDLAAFLRVGQPPPAGTPQALRPTCFTKGED